MNRLLYQPNERQGQIVKVLGERARHVARVLRLKAGDTLRVGLVNGARADAEVLLCADDELEFQIQKEYEPLAPSPLKIILAVPRPKACGRILESLTELGVKDILLLHANKVEKPYWEAHQLRDDEIQKHLWMGLQQAGDTILPTVKKADRFRPFVEDELAAWAGAVLEKWVLHPSKTGALDILPAEIRGPGVVALGPEGGWTDFEIELFTQQGFRVATLGERILSSETVVSAIAGRCLRGAL